MNRMSNIIAVVSAVLTVSLIVLGIKYTSSNNEIQSLTGQLNTSNKIVDSLQIQKRIWKNK